MPYNIRSAGVPKPGETDQSNEDSINIQENYLTLSDGAGGIGAFSKEWSAFLCSRILPKFLNDKETFAHEVQALKVEFYEEQEKKLDPEFADKFYTEGAAATFLGIHWKDGQLKLAAMGDSAIKIYNPHSGNMISNIIGLETFVKHPDLINCIEPETDVSALFLMDYPPQTGDIVLMCSDALAQFFMIQWHLGRKDNEIEELLQTPYGIGNYILKQKSEMGDVPFEALLDDFWEVLNDKESFRKKVYDMAENHLLTIDDYSLIMFKIS